MNWKKENLLLYAVTDRSWLHGRTLYEQVHQALRGGITMLQLREKNRTEHEFLQEAVALKKLCARYRVPLIINDHVKIAKLADADGVHVGQQDMDAKSARAILGSGKIIGVSARTVEQAVAAQAQGADYLGVGAVFPTRTKEDAVVVSKKQLSDICGAVSIPAVAIGGITADNVHLLSASGISGVAVVGAIFAQPDAELAARQLKSKVESIF